MSSDVHHARQLTLVAGMDDCIHIVDNSQCQRPVPEILVVVCGIYVSAHRGYNIVLLGGLRGSLSNRGKHRGGGGSYRAD